MSKESDRVVAWQKANPDKVAAKSARYRALHPEKEKKRGSNYRAKNPEKALVRKNAWKAANPEKYISSYLGDKVASRRRILRRYGLTIEEYDNMLSSQGGVCAICRKACASGRRLSVDHCHITNKIRGLLCDPCNRGLGAFRDDIDRMKAATVYLEASRTI